MKRILLILSGGTPKNQ